MFYPYFKIKSVFNRQNLCWYMYTFSNIYSLIQSICKNHTKKKQPYQTVLDLQDTDPDYILNFMDINDKVKFCTCHLKFCTNVC